MTFLISSHIFFSFFTFFDQAPSSRMKPLWASALGVNMSESLMVSLSAGTHMASCPCVEQETRRVFLLFYVSPSAGSTPPYIFSCVNEICLCRDDFASNPWRSVLENYWSENESHKEEEKKKRGNDNSRGLSWPRRRKWEDGAIKPQEKVLLEFKQKEGNTRWPIC